MKRSRVLVPGIALALGMGLLAIVLTLRTMVSFQAAFGAYSGGYLGYTSEFLDASTNRVLANLGNVAAQFELGIRYSVGNGVPKDHVAAAKWYRFAADQGNLGAQTALGWCYINGEGVPKDDALGLKLVRLAADKGYAPAQADLGEMYYWKFWSLPEDIALSLKWYRLAAEQGYVRAQANLARIYGQDQRVPHDLVQAYMWSNLVAAHGHDSAAKERDEYASQMTPAQIAEAQRLSREWKPTPPK